MKFNQLVLEKFKIFFDKNNYQIIENLEWNIKLKSNFVTIRFCFNKMEYENYLFIGLNNENLIEINDEILKDVFSSDIKINNLPTEQFLDNIILLCKKENYNLLTGDIKIYDKLKKYIQIKTDEYNKKLH